MGSTELVQSPAAANSLRTQWWQYISHTFGNLSREPWFVSIWETSVLVLLFLRVYPCWVAVGGDLYAFHWNLALGNQEYKVISLARKKKRRNWFCSSYFLDCMVFLSFFNCLSTQGSLFRWFESPLWTQGSLLEGMQSLYFVPRIWSGSDTRRASMHDFRCSMLMLTWLCK